MTRVDDGNISWAIGQLSALLEWSIRDGSGPDVTAIIRRRLNELLIRRVLLQIRGYWSLQTGTDNESVYLGQRLDCIESLF
jgi:hypothetical protein